MLVELRLQEMPVGAVRASLISPMKPFFGVTVIMAVPEAPVLKLRDEALTVTKAS